MFAPSEYCQLGNSHSHHSKYSWKNIGSFERVSQLLHLDTEFRWSYCKQRFHWQLSDSPGSRFAFEFDFCIWQLLRQWWGLWPPLLLHHSLQQSKLQTMNSLTFPFSFSNNWSLKSKEYITNIKSIYSFRFLEKKITCKNIALNQS